MSNFYYYSIDLRNEKNAEKTIVLKQISQQTSEINLLEFPSDDIDNIIDELKKTKNNIVDFDKSVNINESINPVILDTLVELFFSGISISDLATQYNLSEQLIKNNLERKGIVIFDDY